MSRITWVFTTISTAAVLLSPLAAQNPPKTEFTARELFYAAAKADAAPTPTLAAYPSHGVAARFSATQ